MAAKRMIIDADELRIGIEHEMEHTNDPVVAAKIAAEHLYEMPDYYTRLEEMEREAEEDNIVLIEPVG